MTLFFTDSEGDVGQLRVSRVGIHPHGHSFLVSIFRPNGAACLFFLKFASSAVLRPRGYALLRNAPDGHRTPMRRFAPEIPRRR